MFPASAFIDCLRVRSQGCEAEGLRRALSAQLASADVGDLGISPSAILLIRRLEDPLPRALSAGAPAPLPSRWNRAFNERLKQVSRSAERPQRGRVSAQALAVLFADEAEFLACAAVHAANGDPVPWWLRAWARRRTARSPAEWLGERIELLPAAFRHLASQTRLDEVMAEVSDDVALDLCRALVRALALPLRLIASIDSLQTSTEALESGARPWEDPTFAIGSPSAADPTSTNPPMDHVVADPFTRFAGATAQRCGPAQRLLVGIALAAQRDLPWLERPHRAAMLATWYRAATAAWRGSGAAAAVGRAHAAPAASHDFAPRSAHSDVHVPSAGRVDIETHDGAAAARRTAGPLPIGSAGAIDPPAARFEFEESVAFDPPSAPFEGVATRLGGLFYLVNLMEHLGLPEGFEPGCQLASAVGAAGTLEALARGLLGVDVDTGDAVWPLLAELAGREAGTPPRCAAGFRPDGQWPEQWLEIHRSMPAAPDAVAKGDEASLAALSRHSWPLPLLDWMGRILPALRHRLRLAVGDLDPSDWLALPARLHVSEVHIDVVASVEQVRLPLRIAGLDRSPGWVRSLQRVVLIHFD